MVASELLLLYRISAMHPELLNNSTFLKYYNRWLEKPDSMVFASVAEFLIKYNHFGEAIKVCREGLKHMPNSVAGHMALAKVFIKRGDMEEADEELRHVLSIVPSHTKALRLRSEIQIVGNSSSRIDLEAVMGEVEEVEPLPPPPISPGTPIKADAEEEEEEEITSEYPAEEPTQIDEGNVPAWQTVTMAKIYSSQGHHDKAKEIYQAILARDPSNRAAQEGLSSLGGTSS
jgi:tetratricopeptide (TPR) repeat protein